MWYADDEIAEMREDLEGLRTISEAQTAMIANLIGLNSALHEQIVQLMQMVQLQAASDIPN